MSSTSDIHTAQGTRLTNSAEQMRSADDVMEMRLSNDSMEMNPLNSNNDTSENNLQEGNASEVHYMEGFLGGCMGWRENLAECCDNGQNLCSDSGVSGGGSAGGGGSGGCCDDCSGDC